MIFEKWIFENREEYIKKISEIIKENYVFWDEVCEEWDHRVNECIIKSNKCESLDEIYENIDTMLLELNDPHTRFRNKNNISKVSMLLAEYNDKYYIVDVFYGNSFVNRGDQLISINNLEIKKIKENLSLKYKFKSKYIRDACILEDIMKNYLKEESHIEYLRDNKIFKEKITANVDKKNDMNSSKENYKEFKSCYKISINENTEYIKLMTFNHPLVDKEFEEILSEIKNKNLIIDIRGNMGGSIEKAINITSLMLEEDKNLGFKLNRNDNEVTPITIKATLKYLNNLKKVIVLVNQNTGSSAENIFVRALKGNSKFTFVGTETMGLMHQATVYPLKGNSYLQVTTSKYLDSNKNILKDIGIEPDVYIDNGINTLRGMDNQLEAAINIIS